MGGRWAWLGKGVVNELWAGFGEWRVGKGRGFGEEVGEGAGLNGGVVNELWGAWLGKGRGI